MGNLGIYIGIGIALVVIGGISYIIYRKRGTQPEGTVSETVQETSETTPEVTTEASPRLVPELSSLPEDAKTELMNAVWYRCENPHCNRTEFLDVHHIVPEIIGGTNRLDNLIVLCPKCHAAADNQEITEEELQSWIKDRTERFRTDLDWPYK